MKKFSIVMVFLFLASVLLFAGCGGSFSLPSKEVNPRHPVDGNGTAVASSIIDFEESDCYLVIKSTLEKAFDYLKPTITYDNENHLIKILFIAPDGTANTMALNKQAITSSWKELCDNLDLIGETTYETCLNENYNVGCIIMILSDANEDNVLYASLNGTEHYNCINEQS